MRLIGPEEVDRALGWAMLVAVLREAFRQGAVQPMRHHYPIERPGAENSTLLLMPAWTDFSRSAKGYAGVKIITVSPGNSAKNLPAVTGVYLLLDGETGVPAALIDGPRLTLWRTAGASALAASYLARPDAEKLLVVGAGALAPFLARAHASVRPIRDIRIWNRTAANAEAVAGALRADGFSAEATASLAEALAWADIVSCATISPTPLVEGARLKPGAHVDLVGAYLPTMRESDDATVRRARIFVDVREGALKEAGDIIQPLRAGVIKESDVLGDLYALCRGEHPGRSSDEEVTLFKSVGAAIEDLAGGIAVFESLKGAD